MAKGIKDTFLNGAKKVWVNPVPENEKAIVLYKRLGFVQKEMPTYLIEEEGENCLYMEKDIIQK